MKPDSAGELMHSIKALGNTTSIMSNESISGELIAKDRAGLTALLLYSLPIAAISIFCNYYVDRPLSLFVKAHLYANRHWSDYTSNLPDILMVMVVSVSVLSYILYLFRKSKHINDINTFLFKYLAISQPVAFVAKSTVKIVFGRIESRVWLQNPGQYGFHWFQGGFNFNGFPSGHMIVFTALFAVIWRCHPDLKKMLALMLTALGTLLVATNYHFLSDVICGAYLGILIEAAIFPVITRQETAS